MKMSSLMHIISMKLIKYIQSIYKQNELFNAYNFNETYEVYVSKLFFNLNMLFNETQQMYPNYLSNKMSSVKHTISIKLNKL